MSTNPWQPPGSDPVTPSKRAAPSHDNGPKRSRLDEERMTRFLSSEHRKLLKAYVLNMAAAIAKRERSYFDVGNIPGGVETILTGLAYMIGEFWEVCVKLSKMRIDTTMHELAGEVILDELDTVAALEQFKTLDLEQRDSFDTSEQTTETVAVQKKPTGATLFEAEIDERDTVRKAREAALVKMKQAELTREVNVGYMLTALELVTKGGSQPLVNIPPRSRKMFGAACALYYENFVDRVLVNYIQQRQRQPPKPPGQ